MDIKLAWKDPDLTVEALARDPSLEKPPGPSSLALRLSQTEAL